MLCGISGPEGRRIEEVSDVVSVRPESPPSLFSFSGFSGLRLRIVGIDNRFKKPGMIFCGR